MKKKTKKKTGHTNILTLQKKKNSNTQGAMALQLHDLACQNPRNILAMILTQRVNFHLFTQLIVKVVTEENRSM